MPNSNKESRISPTLAHMLVSFFVGSGGAGGAMALVGKEGFQLSGVIIFSVCALAAFGIFLLKHKADVDREKHELAREDMQRQEKLNVQALADFYQECFTNTGRNMGQSLQSRSKKFKSTVFEILIDDMDIQIDNISRRKTTNRDLLEIFRNTIDEIKKKWQEYATIQLEEVAGPPPDKETQPK